ncbi:MAG: hypothetical protein HY391_00635 [Deltaproteobacteria bacterium]|nr:hypothetical protein [Deltaproteobacteria bacterium]
MRTKQSFLLVRNFILVLLLSSVAEAALPKLGRISILDRNLSTSVISYEGDLLTWGGRGEGWHANGVVHLYDPAQKEKSDFFVMSNFVGEVELLGEELVYAGLVAEGYREVSSKLALLPSKDGVFDVEGEELLSEGIEGEIATGRGDEERWIAWTKVERGRSEIFIRSVNGRRILLPTQGVKERHSPRMDERWLVWIERGEKEEDGDPEVILFDLAARNPLRITDDDLIQSAPDVSRWGIVWQQREEDHWRIYGKAFGQDAIVPLTQVRTALEEEHLSPRLWDHYLVWERLIPSFGTEIVIQDLETGLSNIAWFKLFELDNRWRMGLTSSPVIGEKGIAFLDYRLRAIRPPDFRPKKSFASLSVLFGDPDWSCPPYPYRPDPYPWPNPYDPRCRPGSSIETTLRWLPFEEQRSK